MHSSKRSRVTAVEQKSRAEQSSSSGASLGGRENVNSEPEPRFGASGQRIAGSAFFFFFLFRTLLRLCPVACRNELSVLLNLDRKFGSENTCRCCGIPVYATAGPPDSLESEICRLAMRNLAVAASSRTNGRSGATQPYSLGHFHAPIVDRAPACRPSARSPALPRA